MPDHAKILLQMKKDDKVAADNVSAIEEQIRELKARWPAHSVPPSLWQELERLEEELDRALQTNESLSH